MSLRRSRRSRHPAPDLTLPGDGLWYKDAVIYQLHVRAYADSNGDGIGDFTGLVGRLDYIRDLGVTAIWVLPFYPSPLRDDGYDIADATGVHPDYGSLADFRRFLREAHARGLRVITELVLNHTSDRHPWFERARRAPPGSRWRDYYVWSDTPERYKDARIVFKDFEVSNWAWDPVAGAYYWHRFYHHQPDLNFASADVRRQVRRAMEFWFRTGVDGMRLDAVPYLYEREGTDCENLPETHAFLRDLRRHVDRNFAHRMLLAEANQWPEDAVAYFGDGDECHMAFHFPLMPRLFMAIRMEDRFPILDILNQTPAIPETCQWSVFLRNHDELTLEMVTDEERDYMYRVYANDPRARLNLGIRRRLAPLLGNDRRRIELMNGLLFSLPGTPVIYYGDEIGMGDNIFLGDRAGVRTPMQWSADRNAGFSRARAQQLYLPVVTDPASHYESVNVEAQSTAPESLLNWMRRLIALRRQIPALGRGALEFVPSGNRRVLAFLRRHESGTVLVVANLSRHPQYVELDLSAHAGGVPVEIFGRSEFPAVGPAPYLLTLGPHAFHWFALQARPAAEPGPSEGAGAAPRAVPGLRESWTRLFEADAFAPLGRALGAWLPSRRWFSGKTREVRSVTLLDSAPLPGTGPAARLVLIEVTYAEGEPETYFAPLAFRGRRAAADFEARSPGSVVARLSPTAGGGVVFDALADADTGRRLLALFGRRRLLHGPGGVVAARPSPSWRSLAATAAAATAPAPIAAEQSHTSLRFDDRLVLKVLRRLDEGPHPEIELGTILGEAAERGTVPPFGGSLEHVSRAGAHRALAVVHGFVTHEANAWDHATDTVGRYFERMALTPVPVSEPAPASLLEVARRSLSEAAREAIGVYLESAALLGRRTADLHVTLATASAAADFAPEPLSPHALRSLAQALRARATRVLEALRSRLRRLAPEARTDAEPLLAAERAVLDACRAVAAGPISGRRLRIHGDLHLGQALFTGKDFVFVDFEGEPLLPLTVRRLKRSPLRDVAGMLRSFDYAAMTVLSDRLRMGVIGERDVPQLESAARFWVDGVSAAYLRSWLEGAVPGGFLPRTDEESERLLRAFVLEKALNEIAYELDARPERLAIPLAALRRLTGV